VQRYPVRVDHRPNLTVEPLAELCRTHFGVAEVDGDSVRTHFGAIADLKVRGFQKQLEVDITMNPKVESELAGETIRHYNQFLEAATGYSSKERARRLKKAAGPE
jgi:hypothetical protein